MSHDEIISYKMGYFFIYSSITFNAYLILNLVQWLLKLTFYILKLCNIKDINYRNIVLVNMSKQMELID